MSTEHTTGASAQVSALTSFGGCHLPWRKVPLTLADDTLAHSKLLSSQNGQPCAGGSPAHG